MSKKFLHLLAAILAACTAVGGLDLSGIVNLVPKEVASWLAVAPSLIALLGHFILAFGDQYDDGQKNDSFPGSVFKCHPLTLIVAGVLACCAFALTGCQGLNLTASTPWGDGSTVNGVTTIALKPVTILRDK